MPRVIEMTSDNLIYMKQLTATEAARGFADLLDAVETKGDSFLVMRRGRPVATIAPAAGGAGKALKAALRAHRPDREWSGQLRELRDIVGPAGSDPWHG